MEPQVIPADRSDVEQSNLECGIVNDEGKSCENQLEICVGIIDNGGIADRKDCFVPNETEIMNEPQEIKQEEHERELDDDKVVELKPKSPNEAQSDNKSDKRDNQDVEEEDEEEVEEKDAEMDKADEERTTQTNDNQEGSLMENNQSLGRNRRVRQKNRYLLDFHCIDLTKGGRGSNREDYDAFAAATSARTSNRRSTTDSNRTNNEESDVFETKYCRKCSSRTPHDIDGGCQACLYKKIVESSKRKKVSSNRNRNSQTGTATPALSDSNQKQQQSNENDIETTSSISTHSVSTSNSSNASTNGSNKRKAAKQSGGQAKISPVNNASVNANSNIGDAPNYCDNDASISNNSASKDNYETQVDTKTQINILGACENDNDNGDCMKLGHGDTVDAENTNQTASLSPSPSPTNGVSNSTKTTTDAATTTRIIINNSNNNNTINTSNSCVAPKCPKVDSWTPDEVADYIISKGFRDEAELFKTQSVDGISLLLMQRTDFTYGLKIKLGPALKIYDQVCKLKKEYFRANSASN